MYFEFSAGGKEYKLRLNTRNTVALEKQLGGNPLSIFGNGDTIPSVTQMVAVLHQSLQSYHHNITLTDAYDIFDSYLEDGNGVTDFIIVITEIYKVSGIIKDDKKTEAETEKN
jgi:hypothetical protein